MARLRTLFVMMDKTAWQARLVEALGAISCTIDDLSAQHAGHRGARESGGGHYRVKIVSACFVDRSLIERHRLVYRALGSAMGTAIHALSIEALTPAEVAVL